ncbi:hypothetical protein MANES_09G076357v8 [Manihot esculenta]|uniref:Uncharacterized protein n=1 Tax=Manihot esculenta TaxID=3983 RepID=A0ACB7H3T6_MANES|nr:hypothetical protein MANES_09G076357v8 [Manihot esculenta]
MTMFRYQTIVTLKSEQEDCVLFSNIFSEQWDKYSKSLRILNFNPKVFSYRQFGSVSSIYWSSFHL